MSLNENFNVTRIKKKPAMTGAVCSSFTEKDYCPADAITR
jgi:hypothetical protein